MRTPLPAAVRHRGGPDAEPGSHSGYGKAVQIKAVEEPTSAEIDIKADYEAKHGILNTGAPKVFFKYFFVNSQTGEASVPMQALATYAEADGE